MPRLAVLSSTRGTVMLGLIEAIQQERLNAQIELVISNKGNAPVLDQAKLHGIKALFLDPALYSNYDLKISEVLHEHNVEKVLLIGYMRILSEKFVNEWRNKIINVHPSLLPLFAGGMDKNVHQAVLDSGMKETGCTVHFVTEKVDAGPILKQKKCAVLPGDSVDVLKSRVQTLEVEALIEVIQEI